MSAIDLLVEAALDQPKPSRVLRTALQRVLTEWKHADRVKAWDK